MSTPSVVTDTDKFLDLLSPKKTEEATQTAEATSQPDSAPEATPAPAAPKQDDATKDFFETRQITGGYPSATPSELSAELTGAPSPHPELLKKAQEGLEPLAPNQKNSLLNDTDNFLSQLAPKDKSGENEYAYLENSVASRDPALPLNSQEEFFLRSLPEEKRHSFIEAHPEVELPSDLHRSHYEYRNRKSAQGQSFVEQAKGLGKGLAQFGQEVAGTVGKVVGDINSLDPTAGAEIDYDKWTAAAQEAKKKGLPVPNPGQFRKAAVPYGQRLANTGTDLISAGDELLSIPEAFKDIYQVASKGGWDWLDKKKEEHGWQTPEQSYQNDLVRTKILREQARKKIYAPTASLRTGAEILKGAQELKEAGWSPGADAIQALYGVHLTETAAEKMAKDPNLTEEQANAEVFKDSSNLLKQRMQKIAPEFVTKGYTEYGSPEIRFAPVLMTGGEFGVLGKGLGMLGSTVARGEKFLSNVGRNPEAISAANLKRLQAAEAERGLVGQMETTPGYTTVLTKPSVPGEVPKPLLNIPRVGTVAGAAGNLANAVDKAIGYATLPLAATGLGAATGGEGHRAQGAFEGLGLGLGLKGIQMGAGVIRDLDQAAELFGGKAVLPSDLMKAAGKAEQAAKTTKALFGSDTFLKALGRDGADFIAKNAVPLALKGVHGGTLAYAMGLLNDTPSEDMPQYVAFGTLLSLTPGLLGHGLHEDPAEIKLRAAKEAKETNEFDNTLDQDSRNNISASRLWQMHLAKLRKNVFRTQQQTSDLQSDANDPSLTPEERAKRAKAAEESQKVVDFHKGRLNQALTTNIDTMAEFGRQFKLAASRLNSFLNGMQKSGQDNVAMKFLTTAQIADSIYKNSPDLQMMAARGQEAEARQRAMVTAQQRGFVTDPEGGVRIDPSRPTLVVNIDNLMNNPRSVIETMYHEAGEAAQKIPQVWNAIQKSGVPEMLFKRTIKDAAGNTLRETRGLLNEADLYQMFIHKYVYGMTAPEIIQLGKEMGVLDDQNPNLLDPKKVVEKMKGEVIADTLGEGFEKSFVNGRPAFENVRQWARTKIESERVKSLILKVLGNGGEDPRNVLYSHPASGVGESLTPEVRASVSEAVQAMRDLGGVTSSVDETGAVPGETTGARKMSKKEVTSNSLLVDRYLKDSGLVKTQLRAVVLDANGNPISKPVDVNSPNSFEGTWEVQPDGSAARTTGYGNLPPELSGVTIPPGGKVIVEHQVVTEPDGVTPVWNDRKEVKKLLKSRSQMIRDAITNAYKGEPGGMQAYSADNLSFRGTLTPDQIAAIQALPESIVPLKIKNHIFAINDAIKKGQRVNIDYSTHVGKNGEYVSSAPTIRDVQWIGMHFSKDGNFTGTALSWNALHNKFRLWKQRLPGRFALWNNDPQAMYDQFINEYLPNQAAGIKNDTALDDDPEISRKKRDVYNDFLNFVNAGNREINPDRTMVPTKRGEKRGAADNALRSFRLDAIMDMADSPVPGVKLNPDAIYANFLPKETSKQIPTQKAPAQDETNPILKALGVAQRTPYAQPAKNANQDVQRISEDYVKNAGMEYRPHGQAVSVNEELAKRIADHYEEAKNDPSHPEVKKAYTALANEVVDQWKAFEKAGYTATPWTGEGQPYANSAEMMKDVRDNKHLYYFQTKEGYGESGITDKMRAENPMLQDSGVNFNGEENVPVNDVFRVVHDIVGHGANGYEFGPKGEFNAYLEHSRMFSDAAKPALAGETLAQNSWVNFGPHLRDEEGNIAKKGEKGYVPVTERPFAEQKNIALPQELIDAAEKEAQAGTKAGPSYLPAKKLTVQHSSKEKEGSVGGELDLVHFGAHGLKSADPSKFGKGAATPGDLRGAPKTYFYLNNDRNYEGIMRGRTPYVAKVDGNSIYDLEKDPLGVAGMLNREKMDNMIEDAGYAGYFSPKSYNGAFDAVAMFKKTKLTEVQQGREIFKTPKTSKYFGVNYLPAEKGVDEGTQTNESLPTDEQQTESDTQAERAGIQAGGQSEDDRNRLLGGLASVARGAQGSGAEGVQGASGSASRKEVEEAALRKHAEENGLMRDPEPFHKQWQLDGSEAGGEHQVSFPPGPDVVKRTPNPYYPTWADYFDSLQIHNTLFPKAALTFRGLQDVQNAGTDIDGTKWPSGLYSEVSQPFLKIKRGLSVPETDAMMKEIGFRRTLPMEYVNDDLGIKIKDLHGMNAVMLEDENGKEFPYVIDSTIVPTEAKEEQPRVRLDGHVVVTNPEADFVAKPKILVNFLPASQRINLEDYADSPMFALPADRMGVGTKYVGPTGDKKKLSVEAQGGPEHMTLLNKGVWAFTNEGPASTFVNRVNKLAEKHGTDSVLVAVTLQSPINHLKNPTGQLGYVEAMEQARDTKHVTQKQLDAQIKEMSSAIVNSSKKDMDENVRAKWKQITSFSKFADAVRGKKLNFGDMEPFLGQMQRSKLPISSKELAAMGLLPHDIARDLSTDWIFDLPNDTVVGLFEVKKGTRPTQDNTHYSYPWSVAGKPIGFLKDIYHVKGLTTHEGIQKSTSLAWPLQRALPELDNLKKALADLPPVVRYR
jgi:hypothetical protein